HPRGRGGADRRAGWGPPRPACPRDDPVARGRRSGEGAGGPPRAGDHRRPGARSARDRDARDRPRPAKRRPHRRPQRVGTQAPSLPEGERVMSFVMFATWILVGVLAGVLAGLVMKRGGHGLKTDITLGLAGSIG